MQRLAGEALGTSWQVRFVGSAPLGPLRTAIEARLATIVAQMSQWEADSLLSRFNRAPAGAWFALPADFAVVVATALDIAARSGGAFDPTHGRASALLGYGAGRMCEPASPERLAEAHRDAGWGRLEFDSAARRLRQPGGLWLDFAGIAKGYAVDAIADLLAADGIADALVEIGGELVGRGLRADGQPWWVDLETPPTIMAEPLRIGLHDLAVATSGDYVRGRHTLDPRTGQPLGREVASVSVIHRSAMIADAWATALTVLGPHAGAALAAGEQVAARMLMRGSGEFISPALAAMMAD